MSRQVKTKRDLLEIAEEMLRENPICDRCLGRLFAKLGYGWDNKARGEALKRIIVMKYHERIRSGDETAKEDFKEIALNIGSLALNLYKQLYGETFTPRRCVICGGLLEEFIDRVSREAIALLRAFNASTFVVGVICDENVIRREEDIAGRYGIDYWESIKNEIKREVGKRIQYETSLTPDFKNPNITLLIKFPDGSIDVNISSLLVKGRYWKKGRLISQAYWPTLSGPRYFSIEEASMGILSLTRGESIVAHAAGREDVDARMLGSGRPIVIEVKAPRNWITDLHELEKALNKMTLNVVEFKVEEVVKRRDVIRIYKEDLGVKSKIYKIMVYVEGEVSDDEVRVLESRLSNTMIKQRTPQRVLKRRKDIVRIKSVDRMACRKLSSNLLECLVKASGGLYVKELVSGDDGRTTPSIAEILGRKAYCVELDVVDVDLRHDT